MRVNWDKQFIQWDDLLETINYINALVFFFDSRQPADDRRLVKLLDTLVSKDQDGNYLLQEHFSNAAADETDRLLFAIKRLSTVALSRLDTNDLIASHATKWLLVITTENLLLSDMDRKNTLNYLVKHHLYQHIRRHVAAEANKDSQVLLRLIHLAMLPLERNQLTDDALISFTLHFFTLYALPYRLSINAIKYVSLRLPFDTMMLHLSSETATSSDSTEFSVNDALGLLTNIVAFGSGRVSRMSKDVMFAYLDNITHLIDKASPLLSSIVNGTLSDFPEADDFDDLEDTELAVTASTDVVMTESINPQAQKYLDVLVSRQHLTNIATRCQVFTSEKAFSGVFAEFVCAVIYRWKMDKKNEVLANLGPMLSLLYLRVDESIISVDPVTWCGKPKEAGVNSIGLITNGVDPKKFEDVAGAWETVALLCEVYSRTLLTMGDDEFFGTKTETGAQEVSKSNPLYISDIVKLSAFLRNVAFTLYWNAAAFPSHSALPGSKFLKAEDLCNAATKLLQQIHARDSRRPFTPEGHWFVTDSFETASFVQAVVAEEKEHEQDDAEEDTAPSVFRTYQSRRRLFNSPRLGILNNIPFVIPFKDRVTIFRHFVAADRNNLHLDDFDLFNRQRRARATVHRSAVFEDGFKQLNALGPALKAPIEISFIDQYGMPEAGIDGGGVFKEFLTSLSKEAFDVNYGLFLSTPEQLLYPNPHAYSREAVQLQYYEFLGRILGKALYEGILVDAAFAGFFLNKWLGRSSFLDDLPSLDNDLYQGLIFLKNYQGDVEADFSLDFTVVDNEFGESKVVELIPNGKHVPVTKENRLRYIYLMANYRLNAQIEPQCRAFYRGLADLIDQKWIRMFDQQELQILIGGAQVPIDIENLRKNTTYSGAYVHGIDHPTIRMFWEVLSKLPDEERRKMVKFVTSCARPPLLGFGELNPGFTIRDSGSDENRLPTSSTCMNLLKLPIYKSEKVLRE